MVIDTSALMAILCLEPERSAFLEAIEASESRMMSTATFVDALAMVVGEPLLFKGDDFGHTDAEPVEFSSLS